ncbi:MAG: hypothetical protein EHM65_09665 [Acidobacteriales bacterium]|nr:MAG: hypothetical protein EHM65_09665 [Terriglobales bacterium]
MTILMSAFSHDHTDVAIISDRRTAPNAMGVVLGFKSKEAEFKTLRLGPEVAIGFAGNCGVEDVVLAGLFDATPNSDEGLLAALVRNEESYAFSFDEVAEYIDGDVVPDLIEDPLPPGIHSTVVLVGRWEGRPLVAHWSSCNGWKSEPHPTGMPWCRPIDMPDSDIEAFKLYMTRPGLDYISSMKAAVGFCADRYGSVNHGYVLRRLATQFTRVEGCVAQGASLPSSSTPAPGSP